MKRVTILLQHNYIPRIYQRTLDAGALYIGKVISTEFAAEGAFFKASGYLNG